MKRVVVVSDHHVYLDVEHIQYIRLIRNMKQDIINFTFSQLRVKVLEELLNNPDSERGVRVGDIFALMVEYHYSKSCC